MTFYEHSDCFLWQCDGKDCDLEVAFKPNDFMGCVAELRSRGWSFKLEEDSGYEGCGRSWSHYCASCTRKRRKPIDLSKPFSRPKEVKLKTATEE
jgi:hypothetical protein